MRKVMVYRALWGLAKNPFPDHAIASAGDSSSPFYKHLHPGIASKMARAFIGRKDAPPNIGFLWSLGEGEEARGYGKTKYLLWFTDLVNSDLGRTVGKLAGNGTSGDKAVAVYAAFNSADGLSLSNLLFDTVRDLVGARRRLLAELREVEIQKGRTAAQLYASAEQLLEKSGERWSPTLLRRLCYARPDDWTDYVNDRYEFSSWHKVRLGRELVRSSVAFLRQFGCDRLLVMVDQVEDFASFTTPSYKLRRDVLRLAELCTTDPLLHGRLTFVMTLHPRAARVLSRYWLDEQLGQLSTHDSNGCVVRLGAMSKTRFPELVKCYLNSVRVDGPMDTLRPFTDDAIDFVYGLDNGRPGHCLQRLFSIMDAAASDRVATIERHFAEQFSTERPQFVWKP